MGMKLGTISINGRGRSHVQAAQLSLSLRSDLLSLSLSRWVVGDGLMEEGKLEQGVVQRTEE